MPDSPLRQSGSAVLRSPAFTELAATAARTCPLPSPSSLTVTLTLPETPGDPARLADLFQEGELRLDGKDADLVRQAGALCAHMPAAGRWHCRISQIGESGTAQLEADCGHQAEPPVSNEAWEDPGVSQRTMSPPGPDDRLVKNAVRPGILGSAFGLLAVQRFRLGIALLAVLLLLALAMFGIWSWPGATDKLEQQPESEAPAHGQESTASDRGREIREDAEQAAPDVMDNESVEGTDC